jgi:hypothetical protein
VDLCDRGCSAAIAMQKGLDDNVANSTVDSLLRWTLLKKIRRIGIRTRLNNICANSPDSSFADLHQSAV